MKTEQISKEIASELKGWTRSNVDGEVTHWDSPDERRRVRLFGGWLTVYHFDSFKILEWKVEDLDTESVPDSIILSVIRGK